MKSRSEKRRRTRLIAVRLLPDEHDALKRAAACAGVPVGRFVRKASLQAAWDDDLNGFMGGGPSWRS